MLGGKRLTCFLLSAIFAAEALYGIWSIRVWRMMSQMATFPGEHLDVYAPAWHPYTVWTKVADWMMSSRNLALPEAAGQIHATMWTMVIGGALCCLLFFALAIRSKAAEGNER